MKLPFALIFNIFLGFAVLSYLRAVFGDPGVVPQRWQEFVSEVGDMLSVVPSRHEWQPGKATYCSECGQPRPERAHHCKVCDVCILRMDHHCPWLANCVGFRNHKYFILSVAYSLVTCMTGLLTSLPELAACFEAVVRQQRDLAPRKRWVVPVDEARAMLVFGAIAVSLAMVLSTVFAAPVGCVLGVGGMEGRSGPCPKWELSVGSEPGYLGKQAKGGGRA